jgi:hypothetical protein
LNVVVDCVALLRKDVRGTGLHHLPVTSLTTAATTATTTATATAATAAAATATAAARAGHCQACFLILKCSLSSKQSRETILLIKNTVKGDERVELLSQLSLRLPSSALSTDAGYPVLGLLHTQLLLPLSIRQVPIHSPYLLNVPAVHQVVDLTYVKTSLKRKCAKIRYYLQVDSFKK